MKIDNFTFYLDFDGVMADSAQECIKTSFDAWLKYNKKIRNKLKNTQKEIELHLNEKKPLKNSSLVQSVNEIINPLKVVYNSQSLNLC